MQQIQSLLFLQGTKYPENPEVQKIITDSNSRITAIAEVHNLLYKSKDLSRISLKEYVNQLCRTIENSRYLDNKDITFKVDVEEIQLLFDQTISVGLILNELITNSLSYAFPEKQDGTINIVIKEHIGGSIGIEYWDSGIGVPDSFNFESQSGLGMKLVYNICQNQLLGSIERNSARNMSYKISIPSEIYHQRV